MISHFLLDKSKEAVLPPLSRCDTDALIAEATDSIANIVIDASNALERSNTAELLKAPLDGTPACNGRLTSEDFGELSTLTNH